MTLHVHESFPKALELPAGSVALVVLAALLMPGCGSLTVRPVKTSPCTRKRFFVLPGCESLTLQQRIAIQKVNVTPDPPPENCQNLGAVSGSRESNEAGGVRAKAVMLEGNTVYIDEQARTTAFYCPLGAEPKPAPDGSIEKVTE